MSDGRGEGEGGFGRPWRGNLGRKSMLINAKDAASAADAACQRGCDEGFHCEAVLDAAAMHAFEAGCVDVDGLREGDRVQVEAAFGAEPGGGAWRVDVARVGHASGSGGEYDSTYHVERMEFVSPKPHARPRASDDPPHWAAVLRSLAEREALHAAAGEAAAAPQASKPKRKASI